MPTISQVFLLQFSFISFCIAEAHLDVIFPQKSTFDDVMITLAIRSNK